MNNYKHNTGISCEVVLTLEDNLDDGKIPQTEHYKILCKYIPQDFLDNFLGWFGQESIERYINKTIVPIDEDKLDGLANESMYNTPLLKIEGPTYKQGFKAGYRKALGYD